MLQAIKLILERLDAFFRYLLPGVIVLGTAFIAHPSWLASLRTSGIALGPFLAGLAVVVGALTYVVHRFTLHQLLDYISWRWLNKLGPQYRKALKEALEKGVPRNKRNYHIAVRSSQLIFLFISIEALAVFTILPPEGDSVLGAHPSLRWALLASDGLAAGFAVWQYSLVNELDRTLSR